MSINNTTRKTAVMIGNGTSVKFPFVFRINDEEDLKVYVKIGENGQYELKTLNTDYKLSDLVYDTNNNIISGNIEYPIIIEGEPDQPSPLTSNDSIYGLRETPKTQEESSAQVSFKSKDMERALDKATMQIQELQEEVDRSYKAPSYQSAIDEADFYTVAENIDKVNTVASNIPAIETSNDNAAAISTVANNISDVNAVGQNIEDVGTVALNLNDVSTVADISSDVTQVAGVANAVQTVSDNNSEVLLVADNLANINTVANSITDVQTVSNISNDVSSVANNETNINTVATNISNVNTAASNMSAIIAAPAAATNAANSALNAATSATNAQKWAEGTDADVQPLGGTKSSKGWANRAQELVESIGTVMRYKGSVANYAALQAIQNPTLGDTYNVLDTGDNYSWDGTAWDKIGSVVDLSAYRTAAQQDAIDATYLPLSGGTMTGDVIWNGADSRTVGIQLTESGKNLDFGWKWSTYDGAGMYLRSASFSEPGTFGLYARNSSNTRHLIGQANGWLSWAGNEVQTAKHKGAVNGIASLNNKAKLLSYQLPTKATFDDYYETVGEPTLTNGIMSDFSTTDYAKSLCGFNPGSNPWISITKAKVNSFTDIGTIISGGASNTKSFQLGVKNGANAGKLVLYVSSDGTSTDIVNNLMTTNPVIDINTWYWFAVLFTGSEYKVAISDDKTTWTTVISSSSSTPINQGVKNSYGYNSGQYPEPLDGEIDFNETCIQELNAYFIPPLGYPILPTDMKGADGVNAGMSGLVPSPAATDNTKFLKGDGTWATPTASAAWGSITGDLEDQTDLQNELDSKAPAVLLSHFWSDHIINEMSYLRGDTFSWQSGDVYTAVYQHLVNDVFFHADTLYCWKSTAGSTFVLKETPEVGDTVYYVNNGVVEFAGTILNMMGGRIYPSDGHSYLRDSTGDISNQTVPVAPQTETISGYTITYYKAADKHKICLADQETTVLNIYNATGDAKYFILDTTNTRFKLPRWKRNKYQAKAPVVGNGMTLGVYNGTDNAGLSNASTNDVQLYTDLYGKPVGTSTTVGATGNKSFGITTDPTKSGIEATLEEDDMYLYFYVGTFTKTAYQETAGLNSELFNGKVDLDGSNATFSHIVETYDDGNGSGYRVWSDGWCEQYGVCATGADANSSITFLKAFKDTNYKAYYVGMGTNTNSTGCTYLNMQIYPSTTTTAFYRIINYARNWKAEGYIS